jgi:hypothetical protein
VGKFESFSLYSRRVTTVALRSQRVNFTGRGNILQEMNKKYSSFIYSWIFMQVLFCLCRSVCSAVWTRYHCVTLASSEIIHFVFIPCTSASLLSVTPKEVPKSLNLFRIPLSRQVFGVPSNYRVLQPYPSTPQHLRWLLLTSHTPY